MRLLEELDRLEGMEDFNGNGDAGQSENWLISKKGLESTGQPDDAECETAVGNANEKHVVCATAQ